MKVSVEIMSMEFVKPSIPTPPRLSEMKFSALDQVIGGPSVIKIVFFYENQPTTEIDRAQKSKLLKQSLAHTLTHFYPFAGEVNGYDSIICSDNGVAFVEAQVDATLSEAIQTSVPGEIDLYVPLEPFNTYLIRNHIPLALQVSYFTCGGTAIGMCMSHRLADGISAAAFMKSWTQICHGKKAPVFVPEFDVGYKLFPPLDPHLVSRGHELAKAKKMLMRRYIFKNDDIARLKRCASASNRLLNNPSSVEVMSAFIWMRIIESIKYSKSENTKFVAGVAVDLRKRLRPPLSEFVVGNFVLGNPVSLNWDTEIDYGVLVSQFRNAMKDSKEGVDYVKYFYEVAESITKPEAWPCIFSSWYGFSLYDLDYGWGKPVLVCPKFSNPAVVLLNNKEGDGMEAWIHLPEDDMTRLPNQLHPLPCLSESNGKLRSHL